MTKILGYGEDALTLWALKNRIVEMMCQLGNTSAPSACEALCRPSFGRKGGENRSEFGEFDFMLLSPGNLYLGESKWGQSSEVKTAKQGRIQLRSEQVARHRIFTCYVEALSECTPWEDWRRYLASVDSLFRAEGIKKRLPGEETQLASNLRFVLRRIRERCGSSLKVENVILYLHTGNPFPDGGNTPDGFKLIQLDYSKAASDSFVDIS
jgi:hypothetical protein